MRKAQTVGWGQPGGPGVASSEEQSDEEGSDRGVEADRSTRGSPAVRNSQMRKAQTVGVEAARSTKMKKDFDWFKLCNQ